MACVDVGYNDETGVDYDDFILSMTKLSLTIIMTVTLLNDPGIDDNKDDNNWS